LGHHSQREGREVPSPHGTEEGRHGLMSPTEAQAHDATPGSGRLAPRRARAMSDSPGSAIFDISRSCGHICAFPVAAKGRWDVQFSDEPCCNCLPNPPKLTIPCLSCPRHDVLVEEGS